MSYNDYPSLSQTQDNNYVQESHPGPLVSNKTFARAPVCSPMFWWEPRLIIGNKKKFRASYEVLISIVNIKSTGLDLYLMSDQ